MKWIIAYANSSTLMMLIALTIDKRLPSEWREGILRLSILAPIFTTSVSVFLLSTTHLALPQLPPVIVVPGVSQVSVASKSIDPSTIALAVWIVVACALLVRDAIRRRKLLSGIDRIEIDNSAITRLASEMEIGRYVKLSVSSTLPVPIAMGSSEICLPLNLVSGSTCEELEPILAHELAHLKRRDPQVHQAMQVISRLLWWQPLNRVIALKLMAISELRTDDLSSEIVGRTVLARSVLRFAQDVAAAGLAGMAAFPAGLLTERISSLLSDKRAPSSLFTRLTACCLIGAASLVIVPRFETLQAQLTPMLSPLVVRASQVTIENPSQSASSSPSIKKRPHKAIEPTNDDVIAALNDLLSDDSKQVRYAARESLRSITEKKQ